MKERIRFSAQGTSHRSQVLWSCAFMLLCSYALMFIAGCGEKEAPSVRQSRTIAAENIDLQKKLNLSKARLAENKKQYDIELDRRQKLLEKCQKEREEWRVKSRQNVRDQVKGVLESVMADNTRLREENAALKAQIEELQK